jgi:hypothetical protein
MRLARSFNPVELRASQQTGIGPVGRADRGRNHVRPRRLGAGHVDQFGYRSPRRDFGPPPSEPFDYLAQFRADQEKRERRRAAVQDNLDQTRRRNAERRGQQPARNLREGPPQPVTPALAPHVAQAVANGMPGRDLGWWRVDVTPDGTATWTRVDAPGDGPRMTVEQTPAQPVQPQWHPVQRWAPAELTEPSPGTRVW